MEKTAREYDLEVNDAIDERYNVEKSTHAACRYLLDSYEEFKSWTLVAAAYNAGKVNFYAKRGQLNFACADCHVYNSGMMARGNLLSPALGHTSHFPVWRRKWAKGQGGTKGFGTIQRRYGGCNKQVRAKPLKAQSTEYNNLEYFHTYMSNGIKLNGPAIRQ
jgi:sulfur-oxidizing protein SoxA